MRPISTERLAELLGGDLQAPGEALVYGFATDDRQVRPGDAFLAISGAKFDGHEFVERALAHGAVLSIVEREVEGPYIYVRNLVDSIAMMGRRLRGTFNGPVVGVTGSAGKTTTKEFLAQALKPLGKVLKTEGNKNTEYTSPLAWVGLEPDTSAVVIEMAMRGFGQIRHLALLSKPTIAVITNIGYGHMEMVGDRAGIARAKGELLEELPDDGIAVLWAEDDYLDSLTEIADGRQVATFGYSENAHCRITQYHARDWQTAEIHGTCDGHKWSAVLPAVGRHIALNGAAAILAAYAAGVDPAEAAGHLTDAQIPPMRMEVRELNGATILLDTYNASPPAMLAAIETLKELPAAGRRLAVLGEMKELGAYTEPLHRQVARAAADLDGVMFFGEPMVNWGLEEARSAGLEDARAASSINEVFAFLAELQAGDVALIKGSRALELERALERPAA